MIWIASRTTRSFTTVGYLCYPVKAKNLSSLFDVTAPGTASLCESRNEKPRRATLSMGSDTEYKRNLWFPDRHSAAICVKKSAVRNRGQSIWPGCTRFSPIETAFSDIGRLIGGPGWFYLIAFLVIAGVQAVQTGGF